MSDILAVANGVAGYIRELDTTLVTDPQAMVPLGMFGSSEKFMSDVLMLVEFAQRHGNQSQPSMNGQPHHPTPDIPASTTDLRQGFVDAMRTSGMFPAASDQSIPPAQIAVMARVYVLARMDEVVRVSGGWKTKQQWEQQYGYIMNQGWVPDNSWKWWLQTPAPSAFVMGNNPIAAHMRAPVPQVQPSWAG